jgi:hypothetical protein
MNRNTNGATKGCKKYRPVREYSHSQELVDNLPYIIMTILGALIFIIALSESIWGWLIAMLYVIYSITGAFWIIIFVCPYCNFYGTRTCPCGYGQIAVKLVKKKDENLFINKFKKHIPIIVPLWLIPVIAGVTFLISDFTMFMLILVILFSLDSFIILPLISRKYGCAHCPQKESCPWMESKNKK